MYFIKELIFSLFLSCSVTAQSEKVCLPVTRDSDPTPPSPQTLQGRPGKVGPIGLPGQQGIRGVQGPPGQCTCDTSYVEDLRAEIRGLADKSQPLLPPNVRVNLCSVGVKDGRVRDGDMTSSSTWNVRPGDNYYAASWGRLDRSGPRVWIAQYPAKQKGEWIQIDLKQPTQVAAVVTQGRQKANQYVTSYKIMYGNSMEKLEFVRSSNGTEKIFQGNRDINSYVINTFATPLLARYFRLLVESWSLHITMRIDYLTC